MKRLTATCLSILALVAGVSTMAFGVATLFHMNDADMRQAALSLGAIALGLACWAVGVKLGRMNSRVRH